MMLIGIFHLCLLKVNDSKNQEEIFDEFSEENLGDLMKKMEHAITLQLISKAQSHDKSMELFFDKITFFGCLKKPTNNSSEHIVKC